MYYFSKQCEIFTSMLLVAFWRNFQGTTYNKLYFVLTLSGRVYSYLLLGADFQFRDGHLIEFVNNIVSREGEATPPVSTLSPYNLSPLGLILVQTGPTITNLTDATKNCMEMGQTGNRDDPLPYQCTTMQYNTTWVVDTGPIRPLPLRGVVIALTHRGMFKILCKEKKTMRETCEEYITKHTPTKRKHSLSVNTQQCFVHKQARLYYTFTMSMGQPVPTGAHTHMNAHTHTIHKARFSQATDLPFKVI